ncbi:TonB-dependent receptor [Pseudomonas sp. gcc21]|uniref:TonB-dependent receptor domain-containing protein n=1 Tax=Pseudomonas sp. gcc21 TaxID=2726989 RepID=UPI00145249C0|nr:TonB-dependent receptor [Pseudomonas sp. gcc21]QJD60175.1 TonB-dependent receptor [Pseudomonas sp. gcc21]
MNKFALFFPAMLASAVAAANSLDLPDTVITASRFEQPSSTALAAHDVFTRSDIERLQARSVPELLSRVPGVQQNSNGGIPAYFLRGSNTAQTLVLVDGQRIASAAGGIARLDYLSIDNIERVEVIRGPRSSVYGADAIGGVIQIFTRQGEPGFQRSVRFAVGTNNTYQRSVNLSGGNDDTRYVLGASLDERLGHDLTSDNAGYDSDRDGQRTKAMLLRLDHDFNDYWTAGFSTSHQQGKNEFDDAYELAPGTPEDQFRVRSYSGYLQGQLTSMWQSHLELGRSEDRNKVVGSGQSWNDAFIETVRHSASWLNHLKLTSAQRLTLGGDWQRDRLSSSHSFTQTRRENLAGFLQHSWTTQHFNTEVGIRHDDNQHFGTEETWNAALSIPSGKNQQWIVSYATGFRAPTFRDLYGPPTWGPNPGLDPERSKTWELQWRGELAGSHLEASLYRNDVRDLIVWDTVTNQVENIDQARINGLELSAERELFGWSSRAALSIIDPRDRDTGGTLQLRAKRSLSLDMDRQFNDFGFGATWQLFSQRYANAANSETLSGYGTLDLRTSWHASTALRWDLKLSNVLDRNYHLGSYQRPTGFWPAPSIDNPYQEQGRAALLAVTWTPNI